MIEFTDANFQSQVLENPQLTVVDFWAEWCGPCRTLAPILEELSQEYAGQATIGKLDLESNPQSKEDYSIQSIPTLIFFKDGKEVDRIIGLYPKAEIKRFIEKNL